jgi:hypothetical protein
VLPGEAEHVQAGHGRHARWCRICPCRPSPLGGRSTSGSPRTPVAASLAGQTVTFADGSAADFEAVVWDPEEHDSWQEVGLGQSARTGRAGAARARSPGPARSAAFPSRESAGRPERAGGVARLRPGIDAGGVGTGLCLTQTLGGGRPGEVGSSDRRSAGHRQDGL